VLARSLTVLTFDNRGAGRSERPAGGLTLAGMAADAVSVLDAAKVARAHVYGISMGGMIAQELALRYPERVDALVLGATSAGGTAATAPDRETLAFLGRRATVPDEEGRWASVPYVYSERTRRSGGQRIGEDFARRRAYRFDPVGYGAQLAAALQHNAAARLGDISAPTLVVHGAEDRMVPPANGRTLAAAIAGARLLELEDAAHLYTTDEPAADDAVLDFLIR
jgi:pimeloyl-ACP methyl ester carboxylesterase